MPRLTGTTLWLWKQLTSSPMSKVLMLNVVTSMELPPLCRKCVLKCHFKADIGVYSLLSFRVEEKSLTLTFCRAVVFSAVTDVVLEGNPGQQ